MPVPVVAIGVGLLPLPGLRLRTRLTPAYQHTDHMVVLGGDLERALLRMEQHVVLDGLTGPALEAVGELTEQVVCDLGDH